MSEVRFGDYRVTGTLGSGAISTIYEAVHEPLGRVVALKALKSQMAPTSSFGDQIERESKVLADLVHPNVVLLLGAGRIASGRPYIVLEHVGGPSLEQLVAPADRSASRPPGTKRKKPSVQASLAIACGLCSALEHVHGRGVVHRDVKPSNVLITRGGVVKLIDFGIAQRPRLPSMSEAIGTEGITASGKMAPEHAKDAFGTPAYMSPEQILGDFVDGRSDLFSLGVVLYQLLSGSRPFDGPEGDDRRSAAQRIRREAPPPLRERAPHCPRAVERIVMRLLEKSPNDRYPTASAVRERLEAALRAETREEPSAVVRQAVIDAGFGDPDETRDRATGRARDARGARRAPISLTRALLGFAALSALFLVGVSINEGMSAQAQGAHEAKNAGARALELVPNHAGGLRVVATPWAHVRIDGQLVETTPFARPIPLAAGRHWVMLSHPDAVATVDREITIVAGEVMTLDVTMNLGAEDAGKDAR